MLEQERAAAELLVLAHHVEVERRGDPAARGPDRGASQAYVPVSSGTHRNRMPRPAPAPARASARERPRAPRASRPRPRRCRWRRAAGWQRWERIRTSSGPSPGSAARRAAGSRSRSDGVSISTSSAQRLSRREPRAQRRADAAGERRNPIRAAPSRRPTRTRCRRPRRDRRSGRAPGAPGGGRRRGGRRRRARARPARWTRCSVAAREHDRDRARRSPRSAPSSVPSSSATSRERPRAGALRSTSESALARSRRAARAARRRRAPRRAREHSQPSGMSCPRNACVRRRGPLDLRREPVGLEPLRRAIRGAVVAGARLDAMEARSARARLRARARPRLPRGPARADDGTS